jgi:hypothetical protein
MVFVLTGEGILWLDTEVFKQRREGQMAGRGSERKFGGFYFYNYFRFAVRPLAEGV